MISASVFGFIGLALGVVQFASLRQNVRLYVEGRARQFALLLHVARITLAGVAWLGVARLGGAVGLVSALVGFLLARLVVTARIWSAACPP